MSTQQQKFVKGAALLGAAGLVVKLIGAFYRIPLTNIIGDTGIGYYQAAYPIYATLLTLSSAGLPTAISKLVSEAQTRGRDGEARRILSVSLGLLSLVGLVCMAALLLFAEPIAAAMGEPRAYLTIRAIAPAVFFAAVLSAYRGYFQGHQQMMPTASTQIVEQLFKLIIGFSLALVWLSRGAEYGAAGALIGVTLSEVAALALILGMYVRHARQTPVMERSDLSAKAVLGKLLPLAIPVMIGSCVMPIVNAVDNFLVINRLKDIGFTGEVATSMFGLLSGVVNTLVNMPSVLTLALCMSLVPAIARAGSLGDPRSAGEHTRQGMKLAVLIGLPCAVGMAVLARPIIELLYSSLAEERITLAAQLLQVMAPGIFFLGLVQTLTGAIQGFGRVYVPVVSLACGAVVKIALSFLLLGNPSIHIFGAPIGTVVCYALAAVLDAWQAGRMMKIEWRVSDLFVKPALAAAGMGLAVWGFAAFAVDRMSSRKIAILGVALGVAVYVALLALLRAVSPEELATIPGGTKLISLYKKIRREK